MPGNLPQASILVAAVCSDAWCPSRKITLHLYSLVDTGFDILSLDSPFHFAGMQWACGLAFTLAAISGTCPETLLPSCIWSRIKEANAFMAGSNILFIFLMRVTCPPFPQGSPSISSGDCTLWFLQVSQHLLLGTLEDFTSKRDFTCYWFTSWETSLLPEAFLLPLCAGLQLCFKWSASVANMYFTLAFTGKLCRSAWSSEWQTITIYTWGLETHTSAQMQICLENLFIVSCVCELMLLVTLWTNPYCLSIVPLTTTLLCLLTQTEFWRPLVAGPVAEKGYLNISIFPLDMTPSIGSHSPSWSIPYPLISSANNYQLFERSTILS